MNSAFINLPPWGIPIIATVVGAIIIGITTWYSSSAQEKENDRKQAILSNQNVELTKNLSESRAEAKLSSQENKEANEEIKLLNRKIIAKAELNEGYQQELLVKNKELVDLARKNAELANKLSEKNEEIISNLIGGNSFCYVSLTESFTSQHIDLYLVHDGKYPLYDTEILINNTSRNDQNNAKGQAMVVYANPTGEDAPIKLSFKYLYPGQKYRFLYRLPVNNPMLLNLTIIFESKNGQWYQRILGSRHEERSTMDISHIIYNSKIIGFKKRPDGKMTDMPEYEEKILGGKGVFFDSHSNNIRDWFPNGNIITVR